jgi:carbon-monoxide dehydrogenase medium subunit
MRYLKKFDYAEPSTLNEAVGLLRTYGVDAKLLAGGTDLLVKMKGRALMPKCLINLKQIRTPDLKAIDRNAEGAISIGCLATLQAVQESPLIREYASFLSDTAQKIASPQIRNIATVGGNLCNAAPSADMAPPLIAADAMVTLIGPGGDRSVGLQDFFLNPGQTVLQEGEILREVVMPSLPSGARITYQKFTLREAMDIATVSVAIRLETKNGCCENVRIVLGAVAPKPMRAVGAEKALIGREASDSVVSEAARTAAAESAPISDIRASAHYRLEIVEVLVRRAIQSAVWMSHEES